MRRSRIFLGGVAAAIISVCLCGAAPAQNFFASDLYPDAPDFTTGEPQLLETLKNGEPAQKAVACKQLAIHGTEKAVPELAKLLSDEHLASWARIALEAIPHESADEALVKASESLKGQLLVGVLNSVGVRRSPGAVAGLRGHLKDRDAEVASAAAVALGRIGDDEATQALRAALATAPAEVRSAVAEGCILCAEQMLDAGKADEAAKIYDEVRRADVPKQRVIEATRGSIVSRGGAGLPLLLEQLQSDDKALFQVGLITARELKADGVSAALAGDAAQAPPERAAALLYAVADRGEAQLPEAVLAAAQKGDPRVRAAAIEVIGRLGDAASVPALVEIAGGGDSQAAQAAKSALVGLADEGVDQQITARLGEADGATLAALIEVVGQRRIHATGELMKAVDHGDDSIRKAALSALGATVDRDDLPKLLTCALRPKHAGDADAAASALEAACVRMANREATAAELFAALPQADTATKARILHILGAMGGPKALESIAAAAKGGDAQLQDAATRVLGEWMTADAAPVLLDLAQDPANKKYQVRALRGYLRLARQFAMPDKQRAAMCASALKAATRPEERQLALEVLERYPSQAALEVAVKAAGHDELKSAATATALAIAEKLAASGSDPQAALAKLGLPSVKLEIVKAQYGAGDSQKDVTAALQQRAGAMPFISLPSASYNDAFGGDPAPGVAKQLKIEYRIDGKPASASFAENSAILLPMPQ